MQSIAFAYAPGGEPHPETDPLNLADPARAVTVKGAAEMEQQVLAAPGSMAIVLRYGLLYGPGTWYDAAGRKPALHVDAAAHAALLALTRGDRRHLQYRRRRRRGVDRQGVRRARFRSAISLAVTGRRPIRPAVVMAGPSSGQDALWPRCDIPR